MPSQKVAVVTGSNKGIGFAIVKGLCAKFNGIVYLTARNVKLGEEAVKKLNDLGYQPKFHQLDITDQNSIDRLKQHLKNTYGGFDLLVNNAAIRIEPEDTVPLSEQANKIIPVNYYGTIKVCETLFPILRNNGKVVNLSSSFGHLSKIPSQDLRKKFSDPTLTINGLTTLIEQLKKDAKDNQIIEKGWGPSIYNVTKVAISAMTIIYQRQFDNEVPFRNISVNCVHPGYVDTDLTNHQGVWSPDQGARAPLWLALEADIKGKYVWSDTRVVPWDSDAPPAPY